MITEKKLLDNLMGVTEGLYNLSEINGQQYFWDYRKEKDEEGYIPTTNRKDAKDIYVEGKSKGIPLQKECENHKALKKIAEETEKILATFRI